MLELGFFRYIDYLKRNNETKLFPELSNIKKEGGYKQAGAGVSKFFNEDSNRKKSYFTKVGIDKKKTGLKLYNFRHTVESVLNNHPDNIENDKIDTLMGQVVQSIGRNNYGTYYEPTILEVVKKIEYLEAGLPWDTIEGYGDIKFPWEK
jgi:hypothetical protein